MSFTEKNSIAVVPARSLIFLSDVHLGAYSEEKNRELEESVIRLIDHCQDHRLEIVILGDFFDYWMEYPGGRVPPLGGKVLEHFRQFHLRTGSHSLFVTGNHDNWTNGYLRDLGFDVEHEYRIIREADVSIMVLHGDGLSDRKMGLPRPLMHRILRNSYFVRLYQTLLPPGMGWTGMRFFSGSSRKSCEMNNKSHKRSALDAWARHKVLTDDRFQAIVYGHHHRPVLWRQHDLTCMNCGSFGNDFSLGLYANKTFEVVTWDVGSNALISGNIKAETVGND